MSQSIYEGIQPHIVQSFRRFHRRNPKIFRLFKKYASEVKRAGNVHYGAKAIMERIRWHLMVETSEPDFKVNNNYTSCYARLLMAQGRSFKNFFELRSSW